MTDHYQYAQDKRAADWSIRIMALIFIAELAGYAWLWMEFVA
jgi:hypothetical protein